MQKVKIIKFEVFSCDANRKFTVFKPATARKCTVLMTLGNRKLQKACFGRKHQFL